MALFSEKGFQQINRNLQNVIALAHQKKLAEKKLANEQKLKMLQERIKVLTKEAASDDPQRAAAAQNEIANLIGGGKIPQSSPERIQSLRQERGVRDLLKNITEDETDNPALRQQGLQFMLGDRPAQGINFELSPERQADLALTEEKTKTEGFTQREKEANIAATKALEEQRKALSRIRKMTIDEKNPQRKQQFLRQYALTLNNRLSTLNRQADEGLIDMDVYDDEVQSIARQQKFVEKMFEKLTGIDKMVEEQGQTGDLKNKSTDELFKMLAQ